jgi:hypothetical protein
MKYYNYMQTVSFFSSLLMNEKNLRKFATDNSLNYNCLRDIKNKVTVRKYPLLINKLAAIYNYKIKSELIFFIDK